MAKYYKDGIEATEVEVKLLHPNVIFCPTTMSEFGWSVILNTPQPTITELQVAYQNGTELDALGNRVVKWTVADKFATPEELDTYLVSKKTDKLKALKSKYEVIATSKPRVATGLGYDVDGGRDNKDDFFSKWEAMADIDVTTVRDADNQFHPNTTKAQMQTIYRAIVANGESVLQWKWQKEIEIASCTSLDQLNAVVF